MTDLAPQVWKEIEAESRSYALAVKALGLDLRVPVIPLGSLRRIIRKSRRTGSQNALLWSLYEDALREGGEMLAGWEKEDLHEWALGEFFGWDVYKALGTRRMKPKRRSSRLSKSEMSEFIDWFVRKMAGNGIVLSLPGEEEKRF